MSNAWSGDWPIPTEIPLPGIVVAVRLIRQEDVEKFSCGESTISVFRRETQPGYPLCEISINRALPLPVQRYVLLHELIHAVHELQDVMLEHFPEHVQTRYMAKIARERTP